MVSKICLIREGDRGFIFLLLESYSVLGCTMGWSIPLFQVEENEQELAQLEDMVRYVSKHHIHEQPMELIIMGVTNDAVSKEVINLVEQRADLGVTWWL